MANVTTKVEGDNLTITCKLNAAAVKAAKPSASGKTKLLASTGGALPIEGPIDGAKLSLNLTIPND